MLRRLTILFSLFIAIIITFSLGACSRYAVPVKAAKPGAPPPGDTARVFFINPGTNEGDSSTFICKETQLVSYLEDHEVSYVDVPEGEHFFMSISAKQEGVFANLAGGKTYYLKLGFKPGPQNAVGSTTTVAYWEPIVPGGVDWENRHRWVDNGKLVALNQSRAEGWNIRYSKRNQQWFQQFESGEKGYLSLQPHQGE